MNSYHSKSKRPIKPKGFTLIELLVVLSIIIAISALAVPAVRSLSGAGGVNKSISDLTGFIEVSQAYAMANNTYVRLLFAEDLSSNPPEITVLSITPADGTLVNNATTNMANSTEWPAVSKGLILEGMQFNTATSNPVVLSTTLRPDDTDIAIGSSLTRRVGGNNIRFEYGAIQIQPSGEFRILEDAPVRSIAVGFEDPTQPNNRALISVNGVSGSINILREGDLD